METAYIFKLNPTHLVGTRQCQTQPSLKLGFARNCLRVAIFELLPRFASESIVAFRLKNKCKCEIGQDLCVLGIA